jgi:hypothetical protein
MVKLAGRIVPMGKLFHIDKEVLADEKESFDIERGADLADRCMRTSGNAHA